MIRHIDDGSMGGGGPIPHIDSLYTDRRDGHTSFEDLQYQYFFDNYVDVTQHPRYHIFHYCIFCHKGYDPNDGDTDFDGITQPYGSFQINDENMGDLVHSKESDQAQTFMHELGHHIIDQSTNHLDGNGHCDNEFEGWYCYCAMRSEGSFEPNFCSECWSAINLSNNF